MSGKMIVLSDEEIGTLDDMDLLDYFMHLHSLEEEDVAVENMIIFFYTHTEIMLRMEIGNRHKND